MTQEKITPKYIIEQSEILSKEELLNLIENYGEEQYERGSYSTESDYR